MIKKINKIIIFQDLITRLKSFFAEDLFKSHIALWLIVLSLIANLSDWTILGVWIKPVDFPIILHYNVYFGVDLVGDYREVFLLPLIGLILFVINLFLALYFYRQKERIASYIMLMAMLMIQFSLVIASVSVILINY